MQKGCPNYSNFHVFEHEIVYEYEKKKKRVATKFLPSGLARRAK